MFKVHTYWRSTAAYRVRIAMNLKGLEYESVFVNLVRDGGEQFLPGHLALNPQGKVPVLSDGEAVITQSLAIMEYLEETHPEPALLPAEPLARARVRSLAQLVACDMHPMNNSRTLKYLGTNMGLDEEAKMAWYRHWVADGFKALEARLAREPQTGRYCHGDQPGLADTCLVPQLYNARRFDCDVAGYPTLLRIEEACLALAPFDVARPEKQGDA